VLSLGTTDRITVQNYFNNDSVYAVEEIRFADGTTWDRAAIDALAVQSTDGNDNLYAVEGFPDLSGGAGNDTLRGDAQANMLDGGEGNDCLYGSDGNDTLAGGADNDILYGENGDDLLSGGEGGDNLSGGNGNDTLSGGAGNDYLYGSYGNDVYRFARGDGQDTISDDDTTAGNHDVIEFAEGIAAGDVRVTRSGDNLVLSLGTTDQITVQYHFYNGSAYAVEEIRFADGTTWDTEDVLEIVGAAG
jgi:Ca2+-binding RTX toxin-like protein